MQATEALSNMHAAGVIHRDIKPSNILLLKADHLILNDFDVSCSMSNPEERKETHVGAPAFRAPRLDDDLKRQFQYQDDWASLGLSFADLLSLYNGNMSSKRPALDNVLALPYIPAQFKRRLQEACRQ